VARSAAEPRALVDAAEEAWAPAHRMPWGAEAASASFRALWTAAVVAIRFDVTDPEPWQTLTERDAAPTPSLVFAGDADRRQR
jgi:hypothetical protein